ncbi:HET-domain-containing protein [Trematosphaeria pertusa]|uniref:HET-domain-containing protein n=1 Tax=Trematosphaeria pertusa TaxID=390896 RepID=A0A6A6J1Z7_9PLEO|nr:HET-domain-containing protein [Trematosphaeria pertusa]KAF2256222.1 HET-domain-containing protein [Trematosphaeria pertusa]
MEHQSSAEQTRDDGPTLVQPRAPSFYQPLNDSENQIRLLELLPADDTEDPDTLRCTIRHCSIDESLVYRALSYVWGDPKITRRILVDDREAQVTTNLADALFQLRKDGVKSLWIDALCINQKDDVERSHQVQKMKKIYESAVEVIVWLGAGDDLSDHGMKKIRKLAILASCFNIPDICGLHLFQMTAKQRLGLGQHAVRCVQLSRILDKEAEQSIIQLMHRPYWRRAWVIQEVLVARTAVLKCGNAVVPWTELCAAIALLSWREDVLHDGSEAGDGMSRAANLYFSRRPIVALQEIYRRCSVGLNLASVMRFTCNESHLEASEAKDRIYAFLGLLDEEASDAITIDYTTPDAAVFAQATRHLLVRSGLEVLLFSGLAHRKSDIDCPSWVIDWRHTGIKPEHWISIVIGSYEWPGLTSQRIGETELLLNGARIDAVDRVLHFSGALPDVPVMVNAVKVLFKGRPSSLPVREAIAQVVYPYLWAWRQWHRELYTVTMKALFQRGESHCTKTREHAQAEARNSRRPVQGDENLTGQEGMERERQDGLRSVLQNQPIGNRHIFITTNGYLGSAPDATQVGDVVYMLEGSTIPFLLRRGDENRFQLVSSAYVYGMMGGDFWESNPLVEEIVLF